MVRSLIKSQCIGFSTDKRMQSWVSAIWDRVVQWRSLTQQSQNWKQIHGRWKAYRWLLATKVKWSLSGEWLNVQTGRQAKHERKLFVSYFACSLLVPLMFPGVCTPETRPVQDKTYKVSLKSTQLPATHLEEIFSYVYTQWSASSDFAGIC